MRMEGALLQVGAVPWLCLQVFTDTAIEIYQCICTHNYIDDNIYNIYNILNFIYIAAAGKPSTQQDVTMLHMCITF